MRLLIISNMPHHRRGEDIVGWGPTVQEIDHLATLFESVRHVACLHNEPAPANSLPYNSEKVHLVPVAPAGGTKLAAKLQILLKFPEYAKTIWRELEGADVVHIRCPANISLLAVLLVSLRRRPIRRWIKYAGEWQRTTKEPLSYGFQRWWLKKGLARGWVTINGEFGGQPKHVVPFLNPCLGESELSEAKPLSDSKPGIGPLRILFVGSLNSNKGVLRALEAVRTAKTLGVDLRFQIVGDGEDRAALERKITNYGMGSITKINGWVPRTELGPLYAQSHVLLMTSQTEGWPKVLSEAMAYGVVPVSSAISCIPAYLKKFEVGRTLPWQDTSGFAQAIREYSDEPEVWAAESKRAVGVAHLFSYANYLNKVQAMLNIATTPFKSGGQTREIPTFNGA